MATTPTPAPAPAPGEGPRDGAPAEDAAPGVPLAHGSLPRSLPWAVLSGFVVAAVLAHLALGVNAAWCAVTAAAGHAGVVHAASRAVEGARKATDRLVTTLVTSAFLVALLPLVSVVVTMVSKGLARFDAEFFNNSMLGVVGEGGGAHHAIMGTLIVTGLATAMSVPVGMLTAIYLVEYGRGRLARAITFFVDVMTGIPSIVAGLFAYALFELFYGPGVRMGFMGAVALSVLMTPIVVRATEEMLKLVPNELREASYALAVPKWRTVMKVVLPTALAGIATGVTLAVARVIGETAPLLITLGNPTFDNFDPFEGEMSTLSVFAFNQYANPGLDKDAYLDRAWAAALLLILIVMALNLVARLISRLFSPRIR